MSAGRPLARKGRLVRFFSKQVVAFVLLAMLLMVVDLFIYIQVGLFASDQYADSLAPRRVVFKVNEGLSRQDGAWHLDEAAEDNLELAEGWAMLLDDKTGQLMWSERLPDDVPRSYTVGDMAVNMRYRVIADYPVAVWQRDDGLLVVGTPKHSFWQVDLIYPEDSVGELVAFVLLVLVVDFSILFLYGLHARRKTFQAVEPIAEALSDLSQGHTVDLHLKGDLREVGEVIVRVSDELRRKDAAREQWIRGVSHDIRTPLALITGNADAIARDEYASSEARSGAELIRAQSFRIADLVNDLNTASRLEYDMQPVDLHVLSLAALARSVAADYLNDTLPQGFSLQVDVDAPAGQMQVLGDERLLTRALQNLVNNAVIHNPGGCAISMGLRSGESRLVLSVADDGVGVGADKLEALRMRMKRGSVGAAGHGLGLVLVAKVAAAHGGACAIESPDAGGFTASIELPAFDPRGAAGSARDAGDAGDAGQR